MKLEYKDSDDDGENHFSNIPPLPLSILRAADFRIQENERRMKHLIRRTERLQRGPFYASVAVIWVGIFLPVSGWYTLASIAPFILILFLLVKNMTLAQIILRENRGHLCRMARVLDIIQKGGSAQ